MKPALFGRSVCPSQHNIPPTAPVTASIPNMRSTDTAKSRNITSMSDDRLFEVRNAFYLGNYQACISEAQKNATSAEEKAARQIFLYCAYIGQKKVNIVLSELPESTADPALKAVRRLAEFQTPAKKAKVLSSIEAELASGTASKDETYMLLTATVLLDEDRPEKALLALNECTSIDCCSLAVKVHLQMGNVDLATKVQKKMMEINKSAICTRLAHATICLYLGGEKLKNASSVYAEIINENGETPLLLVGQLSALILQEKYEVAEKLWRKLLRGSTYIAKLIEMEIATTTTMDEGEECEEECFSEYSFDHLKNSLIQSTWKFAKQVIKGRHLLSLLKLSTAVNSISVIIVNMASIRYDSSEDHREERLTKADNALRLLITISRDLSGFYSGDEEFAEYSSDATSSLDAIRNIISCSTKSKSVVVGMPAVDFTAFDNTFRTISLGDHKGQFVVLYFFPIAFSVHTRTFIESLYAQNDRIKNAVLMAISTESIFSLRKWIETISAEENDQEIIFIGDKNHQISREYGVVKEDGTARQALFIVDPSGILRYVSMNDHGYPCSVDEIARLIQSIQNVYQFGDKTHSMSKSSKIREFLGERMDEKDLSSVDGILPAYRDKFANLGINKAYSLFGMYLLLNKEEPKFVAWLQGEVGIAVDHSKMAYKCLKAWEEQFSPANNFASSYCVESRKLFYELLTGKDLSSVEGILPAYRDKFANLGINKAYSLFGKFLMLNKEAAKFVEWLQENAGVSSINASTACECMKSRSQPFL